MGIQFNQIDNLQSTFDSLSGDLQGQLTPLSGDVSQIASGDFVFGGDKFFTGNADFSGAQGILVDLNNIYTPNTVYAGGIKIGGTLSSPRNSTPGPEGIFQVSGGQSYFDGQVNLRNGASISTNAITGGTGNFYQATGEFLDYSTGYFGKVTPQGLEISGSATGIVRILNLPTGTGTLSSGELFRSGNYLMVV